jgi:proline iminopeptidase
MKKAFILVLLFLSFLHAKEEPENFTEGFYVQAEGAELFCQVMGKGDPIIFIQGGPGLRIEDWYPKFSKLSEKNLVVLFDHRGSIRSTGELNKDTMNFDVFVKDVEIIRKSLGFEKVSLIGHCWGGALALRYTMEYPEFVDKLVLISAMPASSNDLFVAATNYQTRLIPYKDEIFQIKESNEYLNGDRVTLDRLEEIYHTPNVHDVEMAKFIAQKESATLELLTTRSKMLLLFIETEYSNSYSWYDKLKEFNHPTLILYGDSDWIPSFAFERIHESISNSKILKIQDSGHDVMLEKPEEIMEAMQDFFR